MIDVSDRRDAVILPIKACLQPTDSARGTCRISLNTLVTQQHTHVWYVHTLLTGMEAAGGLVEVQTG